ncbi:MAG: PAS domain S-box protein [Acidobacteria bacterium]|nr:PAS domain S-box protein [Acidobacteriota bacterium]
MTQIDFGTLSKSHLKLLVLGPTIDAIRPLGALLLEYFWMVELLEYSTLHKSVAHPEVGIVLVDRPDSDSVPWLFDRIQKQFGNLALVLVVWPEQESSVAQLWEAGQIVDYVYQDRPYRLISALRRIERDVMPLTRSRRDARPGKPQRQSEERFRKIFHSSPVAIALLSLTDSKVMDVNPAFLKMCGYTRAEVVGRPPIELNLWINLSDREHLLQAISTGKTPVLIETPFRSKSGEFRQASGAVDLVHLDEGPCLLAMFYDVTERRMREGQMQLLESAVLNSLDAIFVLEPHPDNPRDIRIVFVNEAFTRLTGYSREEALGQSLAMMHGPKTDLNEVARIRAIRLAGKPFSTELIHYRKDGTPFWCEASCIPVFEPEQNLRRWVLFQREITERKEYEAKLQELNRHLIDTLERISDGFVAFNSDMEITYANKVAENLTGIPLEKLLGRNLLIYFPQATNNFFHINYLTALREQRPVHFEAFSEIFRGWYEVHAYPSANGLSVFFRDISERHRLEAECRKTAHLESLADQVGEVAQEFELVLTRMQASVRHVQELTEGLPKVTKPMELLVETSHQTTHLAERLLVLSQERTPPETKDEPFPPINE